LYPVAALPDKAKRFALASRSKYTRIAAIRAVIDVSLEDVAATLTARESTSDGA
jgi:hypothetical protein